MISIGLFRSRLLAVLGPLLAAAVISADERSEPHIYAPYATLLERFVHEHDLAGGGLIAAFDYDAALEDAATRRLLSRQKARLAQFDVGMLGGRETSVAFWINAYNFFMIAHVLENPHRGGLVSSVRDYGSLLNPYRVFRQDLFDVGGRRYSLSEIENQMLLGEEYRQKGWKDARVHFAVNCASVSCPPLRRVIYTADNLDDLLDENTRRALKTPLHLHIDGDTLFVTSLFDWYESDFIDMAGSVRSFIDRHVDPPLGQQIENARGIRFIRYDWDLNSPDNMLPWID